MCDHFPPPEWQERRLIELAHYINGYAFKPDDWSHDGTRIIRIEQLNNPEGYYDHFEGIISEANAIDDGDLIFSWSATLKVAIWKHGKGVLNQHLFKVVPKDGYDKRFIYHILGFNMDALGGGSHGSTMKHIKRGEIERYTIKAPLLHEQQCIAEILSTVDEAIEQTETLIAKTQQIKAGLMHDLFTRGVTKDGKLRPPREEAPHLYKESPLGWIPKEWNTFTTDDKLLVIDPQPDHRTPPTVEDGVPYIGIGDIAATGEVDFDLARTVSHLTLDKQLRSFEIFPDAFIFGKIGTIGQPTRIPHKRFFAVSANVVILTSEIAKDSHYAYWHYQSAFTAKQIADATNTTSQPALGIQKIRQFMLAWPSRPEEQNAIISRLEAISETIVAESLKNEKLLKLKAGLMHDLLTGRVRVNTESVLPTESVHV